MSDETWIDIKCREEIHRSYWEDSKYQPQEKIATERGTPTISKEWNYEVMCTDFDCSLAVQLVSRYVLFWTQTNPDFLYFHAILLNRN